MYGMAIKKKQHCDRREQLIIFIVRTIIYRMENHL